MNLLLGGSSCWRPIHSGTKFHLRPLLTCINPVLSNFPVQHVPLIILNLRHRARELNRHVDPYRKVDHTETLVPPPSSSPYWNGRTPCFIIGCTSLVMVSSG